MQVCPDCHAHCSDDSNYCGMCQAKLPNAKAWMTDHKKMREPSRRAIEEIEKKVGAYLADEAFKSRLFSLFLARAVEGKNSPSECERYLSREVLVLTIQEMFREGGG